MTSPCDRLSLMVEGALSASEAAELRLHIADCATCQRALEAQVQLAMLAEVAAAELAGSEEAEPEEAAEPSSLQTPWWKGVTALAAVGLIAVLGTQLTETGTPIESPPDAAGLFVQNLQPTRAIEGRLSYPAADRYRAYNVSHSVTPSGEVPSVYGVLSALEEKNDTAGLVAAELLFGDPERALARLSNGPKSADTASDLAALALADGEYEEALLRASEALELKPAHPQAAWNRAVAMRRMGLNASAAADFRAIAALDEDGWSAEAAETAESIQAELDARVSAFNEARRLARAVALHTETFPDAIIDALPGIARRGLYEAVATATSPEELANLADLASRLDELAAGSALTDHLSATLDDFSPQRAAAAASYRELFETSKLPPEARTELIQRAADSGFDDIVMLTLERLWTYQLLPFGEKQALYLSAAEASSDPWLQLMGPFYEGYLSWGDGPQAVIDRLRPAWDTCETQPGLEHPCIQIGKLLSGSYNSIHDYEEENAIRSRLLTFTAQIGDTESEAHILSALGHCRLGLDELQGTQFAVAEAYFLEHIDRQSDCASRQSAEILLALTELNQNRYRSAKHRIQQDTSTCDDDALPPMNYLFVLAHLAEAGMLSKAELDALLADINERRTDLADDGTSYNTIFLDHIEGRARIRQEPEAAQVLLKRAAASAAELPEDPDAQDLRTYSYRTLVTSAALNDQPAAALELLEEEDDVSAPLPCTLGISVDYGTTVVARDQQGAVAVERVKTDEGLLPPPAVELVPDAILEHLSDCPTVGVIAREPYYGTSGLLPADTAWYYRSPSSTGPDKAPLSETRLVVAPGVLKGERGLPALRTPSDLSGATALLNESATPARALLAMESAGVIEIHAHGLVSVNQSAVLMLNPDPGGDDTLDMRDLVATDLAGEPTVFLVACYSGYTPQSGHRAGGLSDAFITAGASTVIASTDEIDTLSAEAVFRDIRTSMAEGAHPAQVLRDLRLAGEPAWAQHLIAFQ